MGHLFVAFLCGSAEGVSAEELPSQRGRREGRWWSRGQEEEEGEGTESTGCNVNRQKLSRQCESQFIPYVCPLVAAHRHKQRPLFVQDRVASFSTHI